MNVLKLKYPVILSGVPSWAKVGRNAVEGSRGVSSDVARIFHGVLRLRCARLSASAPLRMTRVI